jgi:hypothetical protein
MHLFVRAYGAAGAATSLGGIPVVSTLVRLGVDLCGQTYVYGVWWRCHRNQCQRLNGDHKGCRVGAGSGKFVRVGRAEMQFWKLRLG